MATPIIMPRPGITVESCIITKWHKQKGDQVKIGDVLFSYETDKAAFDEESTAEGILLDVFFGDGDETPCFANVCVIGNAGEDTSSFAPKTDATEQAVEVKDEKAEVKAETSTVIPAQATTADGRLKISPRAKELASSSGADLRFVVPTGPEGRIIERDIRALIDSGKLVTNGASGNAIPDGAVGSGIGGRISTADLNAPTVAPTTVAAPTKKGEVVVEKLSNMRKVIAKAMGESLSNMAQLTLNTSFDATEIIVYRAKLKANGEALGYGNITLNDIVLFAVSRTLKNHKLLNANRIGDEMHFFSDVNLGVAVDTDRGLMVPTIFNADSMSLNEISKAAKALANDVKKGTINPDLLRGGTFTVTNLGVFDVESFTPVINPPQTGILGVDCVTQRAKEVNGEMVFYPAMGLSLTFDHKAIDGAPAAKFLKELKTNLENFTLLLAK